MRNSLKKFIGEKIVIDTRSSWTYIGKLKKIKEDSILLANVDVHDNNDSASAKEIYLANSRKTGSTPNRALVYISVDYIISFSPFESLINF